MAPIVSQAAPAPPVAFVTGVDRRQFDQLFLLMGSMHHACPETTLWVCDFGLTGQQRTLLRRKGILLEIPPDLPRYPHPWYHKSALGHYLTVLKADAVLWIDVDMIVLDNIVPAIAALHAAMRTDGTMLAAASDETLGDQLAVDPAPRFAALATHLHPETPYLNSGFFLCRSSALLERWYRICATMPVEKLFEQNSFNLAARDQPDSVRRIDMLTWNLCGQHIHRATIAPAGPNLKITGPHGRTHMLHATTNTRGPEVIGRRLRLTLNTTEFRLAMRMFAAPEPLVAFQRERVMDALEHDFALLTACGFGTEA